MSLLHVHVSRSPLLDSHSELLFTQPETKPEVRLMALIDRCEHQVEKDALRLARLIDETRVLVQQWSVERRKGAFEGR